MATCVAGAGKKVYLAGTFPAEVDTGKWDTRSIGGNHADTSRPLVEALLNFFELDHTFILRDIFPEDTGRLVSGMIAMLHCNGDV